MSSPRIIGGSARGMRLRSVPGDSTRPVTDRVKEAVFNIIGADIVGADFLDMYAGTGSVGIEALSRGARFTRMIDLNQAAVRIIRQNLETTRLTQNAEIIHADSLRYLARTPDRRFDYLYVAPPQYHGLWSVSLKLIDDSVGWLTEDAWVIVQIHPSEFEEIDLSHLLEFDQRRYGSTLLVFYALKPD